MVINNKTLAMAQSCVSAWIKVWIARVVTCIMNSAACKIVNNLMYLHWAGSICTIMQLINLVERPKDTILITWTYCLLDVHQLSCLPSDNNNRVNRSTHMVNYSINYCYILNVAVFENVIVTRSSNSSNSKSSNIGETLKQ